MANIGSWALVPAPVVALYGAMAAFVGMRQRSRRFTESAEKAVWTVASLLVLAYPFLKRPQGEEG